MDLQDIKKLARKLRITTLKMIHRGRSSHIGSNFSICEIMAVLYGSVLRLTPQTINEPDRDRFILSKGHAAAVYYAVLAEMGFFPKEWLNEFYIDGGRLAGHATKGVPGIEFSSGALGHGLSVGVGMALAGKIKSAPYRVFVVLSDGECNEGSIWEAAMLGAHHRLSNLVAIVDYNKIQALGFTDEIVTLEPFADKWRAFGWSVREVDGHDVSQLIDNFSNCPFEEDRPSCLIAHTIKGKGVSFMENELLWHYRNPQNEEFDKALAELEESE